ncbi:MAG: peroxide stress protein YaaA [Actinobacteria bacterium]|nr:peroxide stress protein YaaA [Actinomycetota bacterium]
MVMTQYRRSVLILLPPSEGKCSPDSGSALAPGTLSWPELKKPRATILDALVKISSTSPKRAAGVLGVTATQMPLIAQNARLRSAPAAPAIEVYSGVLYDALNFSALPAAARKRGDARIAIASALWGLLRPGDRIPAYRFSADSRIPGLPPLAKLWSEPVGDAIADSAGVIVDMRSGGYEKLAPVPAECADRAVALRVLQDRGGALSVVSHHNKATKGRITAGLLIDAREPRDVDGVADAFSDLGYRVKHGKPNRAGVATLDVIVTDL